MRTGVDITIYLCFFEEESQVFEKSCDLIHTILSTLSYIYPIDFSYFSQKDLQDTVEKAERRIKREKKQKEKLKKTN